MTIALRRAQITSTKRVLATLHPLWDGQRPQVSALADARHFKADIMPPENCPSPQSLCDLPELRHSVAFLLDAREHLSADSFYEKGMFRRGLGRNGLFALFAILAEVDVFRCCRSWRFRGDTISF
jgi:hypothetical protein